MALQHFVQHNIRCFFQRPSFIYCEKVKMVSLGPNYKATELDTTTCTMLKGHQSHCHKVKIHRVSTASNIESGIRVLFGDFKDGPLVLRNCHIAIFFNFVTFCHILFHVQQTCDSAQWGPIGNYFKEAPSVSSGC